MEVHRKQFDVRRNKNLVANAGARRKKRGRRGVGVAELFVRSSETTMIGRGVGTSSGRIEIASASGGTGGSTCVLENSWIVGTGLLPFTGDGEEASGDVVSVARSKTALKGRPVKFLFYPLRFETQFVVSFSTKSLETTRHIRTDLSKHIGRCFSFLDNWEMLIFIHFLLQKSFLSYVSS